MAQAKPYPHAYIRGKIVPLKKANVSIMTNSLHYGIGIFGGIKAYPHKNGMAVFRLPQHIERLQKSCQILQFPFEVDSAKVTKIIKKLFEKNKPTGVTYIRPLIYRSDTSLSPHIQGKYDLAVYMLDMPEYFDSKKGVSVCVSSWQRNSDNAIPPRTKATGGYINSSLAINDANAAGYDSAILLDEHGNVSEGAVMNLFLVRNNVLITPSIDSGILEGITRRTVMELAKQQGIKTQERVVSRSELYAADEVFFTGTAANISWCSQIDARKFKKGSITKKLETLFANLITTNPELFTVL